MRSTAPNPSLNVVMVEESYCMVEESLWKLFMSVIYAASHVSSQVRNQGGIWDICPPEIWNIA